MSMRILRFFLSVCWAMGGGTGLLAQEVRQLEANGYVIKISYWGEDNGPPSIVIRDLVNDHRGIVWMATDVGLVSLDGKRFKVHDLGGMPELRNKPLGRIIVDARDRLWLFFDIGNNKSYIAIYDPLLEQTHTLEEYTGSPLRFSSGILTTVFEDAGKIWLIDPSTSQIGYFDANCRWQKKMSLPAPDTKKRLYFTATDYRFWRLDLDQRNLELLDARGAILAQYGLNPNIQIDNTKLGPEGALYFVSPDFGSNIFNTRLLRCDPESGPTIVQPNEMPRIKYLKKNAADFSVFPNLVNNSKGICVVSYPYRTSTSYYQINVFAGNTLLYSDLGAYLRKQFQLHLNFPIFPVDDGSFWMMGIGGIVRIEVEKQNFSTHFRMDFTPPSTRGLATAGNRLYANSYDGLLETDIRTGKTRRLAGAYGTGLLKQGNLLWMDREGLSIAAFNLQTLKEVKLYSAPSNTLSLRNWSELHLSPAGDLLVCSGGGLYRFSIKNRTFDKAPLLQAQVNCMYRNATGLWVGCNDGIWLLDNLDQPVRHFTREISVDGQLPNVKHMHEDRNGVFWLATNHGVLQWKPFTDTARCLNSITHGIPSNKVHAVFEDSYERLWMPSDGGLLLYNKKTDRFRIFTQADGLPSSEFNRLSYHRSADGRLYFGGVAGVASFHPDSIEDVATVPKSIYLFSLVLKSGTDQNTLNNLNPAFFSDQGLLNIPANTTEIKIRFCVPAFLGERINYFWRIPEIDSSWHILYDPGFSLYKLPFGRYNIEVSAGYQGNDTKKISVLRLPIRVERPFYLTTWFVIASLLCLFGLIFLAFRLRQRALYRQNQQLASEVLNKTTELQQERDVIAQQATALQQVHVEKMQFFQDLSHEIRNPMTLILAPVQDMMKQEGLAPKQAERLERIKRNAQKVLVLIGEVLELTKAEAGVATLEEQNVSLSVFIQQIFRHFEMPIQERGIDFKLESSVPESLVIKTDARKLEKILVNLLQNAIKFTPKGGTITLSANRNEQGMLELAVRDTGIGIALENHDRIFERYYQVTDRGHKRISQGGFGIGLSMCRTYVQLMSGEISVESIQGTGTLMLVRIPCVEVPAPPNEESMAPSTTPNGLYGDRPIILLVDDDEEILDHTADLLAPYYQIARACNAEEALAWLETHQAALVISDLLMPGLSGLELLATLRKKASQKNIPFILLTGSGSDSDMKEAERLRVDRSLSKPVDEQELLGAIQQTLGKSFTTTKDDSTGK